MFQFDRVITVIDAHTAGEPIRVITSGIPLVKGATMLEKREYFAKNLDHLRSFLMKEPRGHKDMFGALITPPVTDDGDFGVLFLHNEGQSTMCGHGTIGVAKVAAETGIVNVHEGDNLIRIDTPAGRVTATASVNGGRVKSVSFKNVPSFLHSDNVTIPVDGIGEIKAGISYGGAFYVFVEEEKLGLKVLPEQTEQLIQRAMEIKGWVNSNIPVAHPENNSINGIYGVIITSPIENTDYGRKSRQVCIFADGAVDRSPCGTGTSARLALLHARGMMSSADKLRAASIIGTEFVGSILEETNICGIDAIIPQIAGPAWITGFNQLVLDSEDPLPEGFLL